MKKLFVMIFAVGLVSSCTTLESSYQYKKDHSLAFNLARAGGLYDAKDYDIPRDQRDDIINKGWDVMDNALLFNSAYGFGLDWSKSLGLGLITSAFAPKGVMERDSVFGWVPETQAGNAEEAWELMSNTLLDGVENSLKQANVTYTVSNKNLRQKLLSLSEYIFSSVQIIAPKNGCSDWEKSGSDLGKICYVTVSVYAPTKKPRKIPDFVIPGTKGYGFYAGDETYYSRIEVNIPKSSSLNKNQLLAAISRELPPWVFIFVASQKLDTGGYTAPVVLTEGKAELFITPDQG